MNYTTKEFTNLVTELVEAEVLEIVWVQKRLLDGEELAWALISVQPYLNLYEYDLVDISIGGEFYSANKTAPKLAACISVRATIKVSSDINNKKKLEVLQIKASLSET